MVVGQLNKRITIEYPTSVSDSMGGYTTTWTALRTVWAAIWPVSANEQVKQMQIAMTISHRIRIRYPNTTILSSYRIKYGSRYFGIVSIVNTGEKNEWLDILARETA